MGITVGDVYGAAEDGGATASDNLDGDLTSSIVTTGLPVDSSAVGTQLVTYSVTDSQNLSASISRSIVVLPDTPVFNQAFAIHPDATGFRICFSYTAPVHGSAFRFVQIELGSHPVVVFILRLGP